MHSQPRGRPFGNVELGLLATERQVMVTREVDGDSWAHALQVNPYLSLRGFSDHWISVQCIELENSYPYPRAPLSRSSHTAPHACMRRHQVRDLGALHIGKRTEGLALLDSYQAWIDGGRLLEQQPEGKASSKSSDLQPSGVSAASGSSGSVGSRSEAPGAFAALVANVILVQRRKALESAFSGEGPSQGPTEFMAQDLE